MTNFKGTKGKWYSQWNGYYFEIINQNEKVSFRASSFLYDITKNPPEELIDSDENKANALLISKAPEMLEMLEGIAKLNEGSDEFLDSVRNLIKEATEL